MHLKISTTLTSFLFLAQVSFSAIISGTIKDNLGNNIPFASVYVENSTIGVSANFEGKYFMELPSGKYTLLYSLIGFETLKKEISISKNQHIKIDVVLNANISQLDEVEIIADRIDMAKKIMQKVRKKRTEYLNNINNYECDIYVKSSFEKEYKTKDTILGEYSQIKDINEYLKKDKLNLIEYLAKAYFKKPNKYKEKIIAYHNFTEEKPIGKSITVSAGIESDNIAPSHHHKKNPYIFETNNLTQSFNFYKNILNLPELSNQPLKSPIAASSFLAYKYEYIESFYENNSKIFKIKVKPINNHDALFYGNIFIEDSTFALIAVDLEINEDALMMHKNFKIIENYSEIENKVYLPTKLNIIYTIKDGKKNILGETRIKYQGYIVNNEVDTKIFNNEIKTFEEDAFDKDSTFWEENRLLKLKENELKFITKTDSIKKYYASNEFLDKQDSIYNRINWWSPFVQIGYRNHYSGLEYGVGGLLQQVVPFGIGGYRHKLPFFINKEFKNGMLLETKEAIDYGFNNKDIKGSFGLGLTYFPKKFVRTFITIGNTYELINTHASIEQTFSRSNYVNTKSVKIKQRVEIFNGLFSELSLLYSNQLPIVDLHLSKWSKYVFRELNEPIDFEQYIKSEIKLRLKYVINQKYMIKEGKKIILGDNNPELFFEYRKGIPNLFGSEVNYDYVELGARAEHKLARFGSSRWQILAGTFFNKTNLRILEYKYFRGSDIIFFSDPIKSFQLLGKTLNTNSEFLQANYIHHFNGTILNKVPLIKYFKITLAGGAGTMSIPDQNFYHFEMFAGIERVIRIKKQLFRLGIYGVTADNTLSNPNITLKVGISPFDAYSKKWTY